METIAKKNAPIIDLIDRDIGKMTLSAYSLILDYPYRNLWAVHKGDRTLPLEQIIVICKRLGLSLEEAVQFYLNQDSIPRKTKTAAAPLLKSSLMDGYNKNRDREKLLNN